MLTWYILEYQIALFLMCGQKRSCLSKEIKELCARDYY